MAADLQTIVIVGGARDFHAMDWYRAVRRVCPEREVIFVTDLFGGEGYTDLSRLGDKIYSLIVIDKFLFPGQSRYSNLWRNFFKLVLLPLQAARLRANMATGMWNGTAFCDGICFGLLDYCFW